MRYVETVTLDPWHVDAAPGPVDDEHVGKLVTGLKEGRRYPPVRLNGQRELVSGFHRLAAHRALKLPITAEVYEYESDAEQRMDALAENLRRRKLPPAEERQAIAEMVRLAKAVLAAREVSGDSPKTPPGDKGGRPRSPDREAAREVASKIDRSERTVMDAVRPKPAPLIPPAPKPRPLRSRILDLHADVAELKVGLVALMAEVTPYAAAENRLPSGGRNPNAPAYRWVSDALDRAAAAREAMENALQDAANEQNRLDGNLRRANDAPDDKERRDAGLGPRTGLGGKRLRVEDPQGELLAEGRHTNEPPEAA